MKKITKHLKNGLLFLAIVLLISLVCAILNTVGLNKIVTDIISLIFVIVLFFYKGFVVGKKTDKKGFIEGLKTGALYVLFLIIVSKIFYRYDIKLSNFVYHMILILSSIFGAIFGKNKK